jgi:hypothetical protein
LHFAKHPSPSVSTDAGNEKHWTLEDKNAKPWISSNWEFDSNATVVKEEQ